MAREVREPLATAQDMRNVLEWLGLEHWLASRAGHVAYARSLAAALLRTRSRLNLCIAWETKRRTDMR